MRSIFVIVFFLFCLSAYASQTDVSAHVSIAEYENFSVRVNRNAVFRLEIPLKCLSVQRTNGVTLSDGEYKTTGGGTIYFDNRCFDKQKPEIIFRFNDGKVYKLKYNVNPRIEEKSDMGC